MIGVNKVILVGNLGKDPEVVTLSQETRREDGSLSVVKKATFSLATTECRKGKDGERIEQTDWHNIVCWRGLAEVAEKKLFKGAQVYIEGKLQSRSWEDKEGTKRYVTEVVADNFLLLGNKNRNGVVSNANNTAFESIINEDTEPMGDLPF